MKNLRFESLQNQYFAKKGEGGQGVAVAGYTSTGSSRATGEPNTLR